MCEVWKQNTSIGGIVLKKGLITLVVGLMLAGVLAGCEEETVPVNTELPRLSVDKENKPNLKFEHKVGDSTITTSYDLGSYKLENWRITDSKAITFNVGVKDTDGSEVLVEHVHADVAIKATHPQLNGLTQDSMDNSYHGTSQDGFLIDTNYAYKNIFAVDGFSKDIIDGWMLVVGDYGSGSISSQRLTEQNLISAGAYGSEVVFVYNLLVKAPGAGNKYHIETFEDRFIVPTPKKSVPEKK